MKNILFNFLCSFFYLGALSLTACVGGKGAVTIETAPTVVTTFKTVLNQLPKGNGVATNPIGVSSQKPRAGLKSYSLNDSIETYAEKLSCYTSSPATPIDADSDGIALLKEYSFDCEDFVSGENTFNHKGSYKSIDKDDTVAGDRGGYRFEFDIPSWYYKNNSENLLFGGSFNGYWDTSGTNDSTKFKSDFKGSQYAEFEAPGHGILKTDYTYTYKWDVTFTPTLIMVNSNSQVSQWAEGTMVGSGSFAIEGNFVNEKEEGGTVKFEVIDGTASMSWKAVDVTFKSNCAVWYKSGSHILTDVGGNKIEIKFNCSDAKIYFNGEEMKDTTW